MAAAGLTATALLGLGLAQAPPPIPDQHGRLHGLADHQGRPVAALVVTVGRLRHIRGWEVELGRRFPELRFLRAAHVPPRPGTSRESVAKALRGRVPDEVPVMIDMEGAWAAAYGLDPGDVNVLLFDRGGARVFSYRGRRDERSLARVGVEIEGRLGLVPAAVPGKKP
jgi:hypothetical protein